MSLRDMTGAEADEYRAKYERDFDQEESPVWACGWFALCTNEATTTRPHPILGSVPVCARCDAKAESLS